MCNFFSKISLAFIFILVFSVLANAQAPDAATADGKNDSTNKLDLPKGIKETLAKQRIEREEKEYQELVGRGEEAVQLSSDLNKSLEGSRNLSAEDLKKLDRLEKLIKKIRSDLGAKNDESDETRPEETSLPATGKNLEEMTGDLLSEIKKIGRHTISVVAIESSNSLLKLVRFLRSNN